MNHTLKKIISTITLSTFLYSTIASAATDFQARIPLDEIKKGSYKESVPSVNYFNINPSAITEGESADLTWSVKSGKYFKLIGNGSSGDAFSSNSAVITPVGSGSFSYTLEAYNSLNEKTTATTNLDVVKKPLLSSFKSSANMIYEGQSVSFTWTGSNVDHYTFNDETINTTSHTVTPEKSGSFNYVLSAYNALGYKTTLEKTIEVISDPIPSDLTFNVSPNSITLGESSTATWESQNSVKYDLTGEGVVSNYSNNTAVITPTSAGSKQYKITAYNNQGQSVSSTKNINVIAKPVINNFNASKTAITQGETVTLSWDTQNATNTKINDSDVAGNSVTYTPDKNTSYTLSAVNANGYKVTKSLDVNVVKPTTIEGFSADQSEVYPGQSVTLSWNVSGGSSYTLNGSTVNGNSTTVSPNETTQYILKAKNSLGNEVSKNITVTVIPEPLVSSFSASPTSIGKNQNSTLSWVAENANAITVNGSAVNGNSLVVNPTATTTYTIVASNKLGRTSTKNVTVNYVADSSIDNFSIEGNSNNINVYPGKNLNFTWTTDGTAISINNTAVSGSSASIPAPMEAGTYTYTLTVKNGAGVTISRSITVNVIAEPIISSFTTDKNSIGSGQSAILSWSTTGSNDLSINGTPVSGSSFTVSPTSNTIYTLLAKNTLGRTTSKTVTVNYVPSATISSFTADGSNSANVYPGKVINFAWSTTGTPKTINTTAVSGTSVNLNAPTTPGSYNYVLTVANSQGVNTTSTVSINVIAEPVISSFTSDKTGISSGESAVLSWVTSGANTLTLNNEVVTGSNKTVTPTNTTNYTLVATNSIGRTTSQTVVIGFAPSATISSFTVNSRTSYNAFPGDVLAFVWNTNGTPKTINNNAVFGNNTTFVAPATPGNYTYTLTVQNSIGSNTTANVIVNVIPEPTIDSFTTTKTVLGSGQSATLAWNSGNYSNLTLNNAPVTGSSIVVSPTTNTTYTLTATNSIGRNVSKSITISYYPDSTINMFRVNGSSRDNVYPGANLVFEWVTNGTPKTINSTNVVGNNATFPAPTTPGNYSYTLTVENNAGILTTATVPVTVVAEPVISSFTTDKNTVGSGQSATLAWSTSGSTQLTLNGASITGTSKSVTPNTTTSYTLIATNSIGRSVSKSVTINYVDNATISSFIVDGSTTTNVYPGKSLSFAWTTNGTPKTINSTAVSGSSVNLDAPTTPGSYSYVLTVQNSTGISTTSSVNVNVIAEPSISTFTASPTSIGTGQSSTLSWTANNANSLSINGTTVTGSTLTVSPTATTTYTLVANNSIGRSVSKSITVNYAATATINTPTYPSNVYPNTAFLMNWGGDNVTNYKLRSDNASSGIPTTDMDMGTSTSTSITPTAPGSYIYTLTALNTAGVPTTRTIPITVEAEPTVVTFTANPTTVSAGGNTTLTWNVLNASTITITDVTVNASSSSSSVAVGSTIGTKTYTLNASRIVNGIKREIIRSVNVNVVSPATIGTFTGPTNVYANNGFTLNWSGTNISNYTLSSTTNNSGVPSSGISLGTATSTTVTPTVAGTYTYTLYGTNASGNSVNRTFTVTVESDPLIYSFTASPTSVVIGKNTTLSWSTSSVNNTYLNNSTVSGTSSIQNVGLNPGNLTYTLLVNKTVNGITRSASRSVNVAATCTPPNCLMRNGFTSSDYKQTGSLVGSEIQTNGSGAGALLFGPYVDMNAGTYIFSFTGAVGSLVGSPYIDIVSNGGNTIYYRKYLSSNINGTLASGNITIPTVTVSANTGLEVRVMGVSPGDNIILRGYVFRPQ